jgi:SAM-dependent methyltransferase
MTVKSWYDIHSSKKITFVPSKNMVHRKILAYLHPKKSDMLLDVACGNGDFLALASKTVRTYGVDFSVAFKEANSSPNSDFVMSSGLNLPFKNGLFKYVTIQGSLEHFPDPLKGLEEIYKVSSDNAKVAVLVPNRFYLFRYREAWVSNMNGYYVPIELFLSLKGWKKLFRKAGFKIETVIQDNHPKYEINLFQDSNPVKVFWRTIKKLVWAIMPLPFTCQFIFILSKGKN